jgi:hypothetical protein
MSQVAEIKSAVIPYIRLVVSYEDPTGALCEQEWKLCFDYKSIAKAEQELKIDLKSFEAWKSVTSAMTPQLVHAGLSRYHPDVTLEQVQERLNPDIQRPLQEALFGALFPGVMEAMNKFKAQQGNETKNAESVASQSV